MLSDLVISDYDCLLKLIFCIDGVYLYVSMHHKIRGKIPAKNFNRVFWKKTEMFMMQMEKTPYASRARSIPFLDPALFDEISKPMPRALTDPFGRILMLPM